jgi:hypothetical protein
MFGILSTFAQSLKTNCLFILGMAFRTICFVFCPTKYLKISNGTRESWTLSGKCHYSSGFLIFANPVHLKFDKF